ncbi:MULTISPECIES: GNAT family N-acetyltransferase [unclassified Saccharothrix]|uniref:GNAT family N-acetyltransferase n=1 Tax=unclassified Saccharothrix TaxID=2593673 RepID=UPI00307F8197
MSGRTLLGRLALRHLEEEDVALRVDAQYDGRVARNIAGHLGLTPRDELLRRFRSHVDGRGDRVEYVVEKQNGDTVGYIFLTGLDWVNRTCDLSITMLPGFRTGLGYLALMCAFDHVYGCLNMHAVLTMVLDVNEMMASDEWNSKRANVTVSQGNYTEGAFRAVHVWTQTKPEYDAMIAEGRARVAAMRARLGDEVGAR